MVIVDSCLNKLSSFPLRVKEAEEVCRQKKGKALYKVKPRHDSGIVSIDYSCFWLVMSLLLNPVFTIYTNLYNNISVILSYVWINNELLIPTVSFLYVFNQTFVVELVSKLDI